MIFDFEFCPVNVKPSSVTYFRPLTSDLLSVTLDMRPTTLTIGNPMRKVKGTEREKLIVGTMFAWQPHAESQH